jgi:23S rRNA G2445 N2-methylase RlmL
MKKVVHWDLYNQNAISDWFDPEWMFGVKEGFDIVIGNPPYIKEYTTFEAPALDTQLLGAIKDKIAFSLKISIPTQVKNVQISIFPW